jgi:hypothetical protein
MFTPKWMSKDTAKACAAVRGIIDQNELMQIAAATAKTNDCVCKEAVNRISDQQLILKLLFSEDVPFYISSLAINHLHNRDFLAMAALRHPYAENLQYAVRKLFDEEPVHPVVQQLLLQEQDEKVIDWLILRLAVHDNACLLDIALNNLHPQSRKRAAEAIHDTERLEILAAQSQDEDIRRSASRELEWQKEQKAGQDERDRKQKLFEQGKAFVEATSDIRALLDYEKQPDGSRYPGLASVRLQSMPHEAVAAAMTEADIGFLESTISAAFQGHQAFLAPLLRSIYKRGLFTEQIASCKGRCMQRESIRDECNNHQDTFSMPFEL